MLQDAIYDFKKRKKEKNEQHHRSCTICFPEAQHSPLKEGITNEFNRFHFLILNPKKKKKTRGLITLSVQEWSGDSDWYSPSTPFSLSKSVKKEKESAIQK